MSAQFEIKGLAEMQKEMLSFSEKLRVNIMRGALRAGARQIANEAKSRVPIQSGQLKNSIRVSARMKGGEIIASIKAGGRARGGSRGKKGEQGAFYAHMVEFGTAAHVIKIAKARALQFGGIFVKEVEHTGAQQRPYFRPAISAKASAAAQAVAEYIRARIDKLNRVDNEG